MRGNSRNHIKLSIATQRSYLHLGKSCFPKNESVRNCKSFELPYTAVQLKHWWKTEVINGNFYKALDANVRFTISIVKVL